MLGIATIFTRWLALFAVLAVAGCASLSGQPVDDAVLEFELQGRIALRFGKEGGNARIVWRHALKADDLLVTNSLGQGIARISRLGDDVQLVTADAKEYQARDAEKLTESVLGWRLPLAGLSDWVRGRAAANRPSQVRRDADGRVSRIEQDAWRIDYLAWEGKLPSRVTLAYDGSGADSSVEIRLIVDQWQAPP